MPVVELILSFLDAVSGPPVLLFVGATWIVACLYCYRSLEYPKDRQRLGLWLLDYPDRAKAYRRLIGGLLNRLQAAARPQSLQTAPVPESRRERLGQALDAMTSTEAEARRVSANPWGWPVLDFAFRLALVYPFLFLVLQWLVLGAGTSFGEVELFRDANAAGRLATMIVVLTALFIQSNKFNQFAKEKLRLPWWSGLALLLALIWILPRTGVSLTNDLVPNVAIILTIVLILNGTLTSSAFWSGGLVMGITAAMASAVLVAGKSLPLAFGAFLLALVSLFPAGMLIGLACASLVRRNAGFTAYLLLSLCWLAVIGSVAAFLAERDVNYLIKAAFLFVCVLPLVNAWFDYISYALTLTLVRWGLQAKGWMAALFALGDVVLALLVFTLLGISITAILATINQRIAPGFYPLAPVFDGAAHGDPEYFWVYAMIFSTFVPTFLHLAAASLSLVSVVPRWFREWLWQTYSNGSDDLLQRSVGCGGIGLLATATAVLPLACAYGGIHVILSTYEAIGDGYLTIFRNIAAALGEPV